MRSALVALFILTSIISSAQKKSAFVSGKVIGQNEEPLSNVSITILGRSTGITSSDSGTFRLKVPADRAFALVFSYSGYRTEQRNFLLSDKEEETITVRMETTSYIIL